METQALKETEPFRSASGEELWVDALARCTRCTHALLHLIFPLSVALPKHSGTPPAPPPGTKIQARQGPYHHQRHQALLLQGIRFSALLRGRAMEIAGSSSIEFAVNWGLAGSRWKQARQDRTSSLLSRDPPFSLRCTTPPLRSQENTQGPSPEVAPIPHIPAASHQDKQRAVPCVVGMLAIQPIHRESVARGYITSRGKRPNRCASGIQRAGG